jgi:SNF2 family DNA or RNA helicase
MDVFPNKPFQIVYALFHHEYLGYLFESFVVQLDGQNRLTLAYQNISSRNAKDFASRLTETDFELIALMDSIQGEAVFRKFAQRNRREYSFDFFFRVYDPKKGDTNLQKMIAQFVEDKKVQILSKLKGKLLFVMGNENPTHKPIKMAETPASILFHFFKNQDNTHYFPTIKYEGKKLEFRQRKDAFLICTQPAWLLLDDTLYHFEKHVDGNKLKPFLQKKCIVIPKNLENEYYQKFVAPLISQYDVHAEGFEIVEEQVALKPILKMEVHTQTAVALFGEQNDDSSHDYLVFELYFKYGDKLFKRAENNEQNSVVLEKKSEEQYVFRKFRRQIKLEKEIIKSISTENKNFYNDKIIFTYQEGFEWLYQKRPIFEQYQVEVWQSPAQKKRFFLGKSKINLEFKENRDWFDVRAKVYFGEFEIPFLALRKLILEKQKEYCLPNGEIAVIPQEWFAQYTDLFNFIQKAKHTSEESEHILQKHHLALVKELEEGNLASVVMSRKLESLRDFEKIEDYPLPQNFKGQLRPYQKAGYNWMRFLQEYHLGGCLADDMGLGKTVQTLALLQEYRERNEKATSLLIMPTSLLYNWAVEAKKFTPDIKICTYTGTDRNKDISYFAQYDLILTTYGITRIDIDTLKNFYFDYIVLDESQTIKNPTSHTARAVRELKARYKLILTGTPIENTTLDLWSQMNFINQGLLGNQSFFREEFLLPIEKRNDTHKLQKLQAIIKPFILRRTKKQVAQDLPEKIENLQYCPMTAEQEKVYESTKSSFRNKILSEIDQKGIQASQILLLQGLTLLRQIANHPRLTDTTYPHSSGKMEAVWEKLQEVVSEGHKVLIFSQFVKHLTLVRELLDGEKVRYAYLDGSTKDRQKEVETFQNDKDTLVFLLSIKAGGVGLNLTAAEYVFILDPWWNPAVEAQAIDRAHRIGQKNSVFVYKFITQNSVEEKILALQQEKMALSDDLITIEENFFKRLERRDIEALLG